MNQKKESPVYKIPALKKFAFLPVVFDRIAQFEILGET